MLHGGTRRFSHSYRPVLEMLESRLVLAAWINQGPGPIEFGQPIGMDPQNNPDVGSITALVADPSSADVLYAATTSGGVWMTSNATASSPTWTVLTEDELTLSIGALAMSPLDSQTIYAGTGNYSSGGLLPASFFAGGLPMGVLVSTDGGSSWSLEGQDDLADQNIRSLLATSLTTSQGQVVLTSSVVFAENPAANNLPGGVFLSTDGGDSWTRLSGAAGSGLPNGPSPSVFQAFDASLAQDPDDPNVFYTTLFKAGADSGVYQGTYSAMTETATWTRLGGFPAGADTILREAVNLKVATATDGDTTTLALLASNGSDAHLYYSTDGGSSWTEMDAVPEINEEGRASFLLQLIVDPSDPRVLFVTGDANSDFPNGNAYRGDFDQQSGSQWTNLTNDGATGTPPGGSGNNPTAPHTDCKALAFGADGNLLRGDDGGVYRLVNPLDAEATGRYWVSVCGSLVNSESYSVAYDSLDNILVLGTQDDGMAIQPAPGQTVWNQCFFDDVTHVAADSSGSEAMVYGVGIQFNFYRGKFSTEANDLTQIRLAKGPNQAIYSGLNAADDAVEVAYIPFALNNVEPRRLMIGLNGLYESETRGDIIAERTLTGQEGQISAIAYGGKFKGEPIPGVAYVGTTEGQVFIRSKFNTRFELSEMNFNGSILSIAMDPKNWQKAYVVANDSQLNSSVWQTKNGGQKWLNVTGDLADKALQVASVVVMHPTSNSTTLVVGALGSGPAGKTGSVFATKGALDGASTKWSLLGKDMPNVNVLQVVYDATDDVLAAAAYGRGGWLLKKASEAVLENVTVPENVTPSASRSAAGRGAVTLADQEAAAFASLRRSDNQDALVLMTTAEASGMGKRKEPGLAAELTRVSS